jgi:hypothetical protein
LNSATPSPRSLKGEARYDVVLRYQPQFRDTQEAIDNIRLLAPSGERVSLAQLTTVKTVDGAEEVYREAGQRYVAIKYSVRGRDLGSTVEEAIRKVNAQVSLPIGYKIDWAGEYASQQRSSRRLMLVLPITLIVIFVLLYMMFHSGKWALLIFFTVSMAPVGGLTALLLTRTHFSVSSGVGFLALFGVSVEVGVIMLEYINQMRVRGHSIEEAAIEGAVLRLRPIMMTMLVATLGLLPAATSHAIGNDRYKAGDLAKLDFERLDLQLAQFESDDSNAITAAQQASLQLQVLLEIDKPSADFDVIGDVVPPPVTLSMDDLEQKGLAARPDLKAAVAAVAVADAQVKLATANGTADPTVEADYNRTGTENSVGFNLNIPIRIFDRNQGNKATARFTAQASRFSVTAVHNQVISDVDQAYSGYINSRLLSDRYNGHYLAESKDVLDIARFSYEHGNLALIDYLDDLRDSRSVASDALNAYQQTWIAIHQLSFVTASAIAP